MYDNMFWNCKVHHCSCTFLNLLLIWFVCFSRQLQNLETHTHQHPPKCLYIWQEREREMFYLTTHSTHFIYGYMVSDIWLRTILIVRKKTRCRHIGYSYRLTARVLLYAPSHRQDNTYHGLCYTSRGALAGARNSSMGPPHEGSIRYLTKTKQMLGSSPPWQQKILLSMMATNGKQLKISTNVFHNFMLYRLLPGMEGRKEGNILFNDTLNTFYLRSYGIRHKVKDHSDSEKGNLLLPHRL